MKKKEKNKKSKSGSVKVDPETLDAVKTYCKSKGILISYFVNETLKESIKAKSK